MIYTTTTDLSLSEVNAQLEVSAKSHAFGVLHHYEFKKILESKGFPIEKDITLYEICNPKGAQALLTESPEASVFLPCRISVYEENAKRVLATINLEDFIEYIDASNELKEHLRSLYQDVIKLLNSF